MAKKYTKAQIKANREKWIKALESGKYKQGVGYLKQRSDGISSYCCLGVACQLAYNEGVISRPSENKRFPNNKIYTFGSEDSRSATELPIKVQNWLGLDKPEIVVKCKPDFSIPNSDYGVITLNDLHKKDFKFIAEQLRKKFNISN